MIVKYAPKMVFFNKKEIEKDSDNYRHRKLTLKIRKLQTAGNKKYIDGCRLYQKKYFP